MAVLSSPAIFDRAAFEVGHITFGWSHLESLIADFITHLMGMAPSDPAAQVLDGNMDFRDKIQAAKGLAYIRHFDADWLQTTLLLLDHIDNNLRVRRNAVTHGRWFLPKGTRLTRITRKTKITKPQSFQLALETEQVIPVRVSELRQLRRDIHETLSSFFPVVFYMFDGDKLIDPESSPTISWKQYIRLAGLGNPLRNVNSVRRRQQRSARASK